MATSCGSSDALTSCWRFACPACRAGLPGAGASCAACGAGWPVREGVWRCLSPERLAAHTAFLEDYQRLRAEELRGSDTPAYYRALPEVLADDPLAWQWRIRARSWAAFARHVLGPLPPGRRIVDCGAGCGWLSYRVRALGHAPCSVDINDDPRDGLRAARHYGPDWPVIQADFDALPLAAAAADLVAFNGSLHYTVDPARTLSEALRVLAPGGQIVLLDTPVYRRERDGHAMRAARLAAYEKKHGRPWRGGSSVDFFHRAQLEALSEQLELALTFTPVWYGFRWVLEHARARLLGPRELADFGIITLRRRA